METVEDIMKNGKTEQLANMTISDGVLIGTAPPRIVQLS
jgi:hypothetical protein